MENRRIAVFGAGALGLTAALPLSQRGHRVTVFERQPVVGGFAAGFRPAGDLGPWLEKSYQHRFDGRWVANMFQVHSHDRCQNSRIELAKRFVAALGA